MFKSDYIQALEDYKKVRRNGAIQAILTRISGSSKDSDLLSYDEVRQQLQAIEKSASKLKDIPLDAIVGSVGRYHDFTRKFLPKSSIDETRWARVKASTLALTGLPPIDVYQIGEVYFVKDGNHRVSVARQMGNPFIQAYVTEVQTKVDLTADTTPDDLIIKSELVRFLELTQLDEFRPGSELSATKAGAYPTLLEHIDVHRYFMGLEKKKEIPYLESAAHWHDEIFLPIVYIIRNRGLLRDFPERTVVDLYLWAAEHRAELADKLGWDIGPEAALVDLAEIQNQRSFSSVTKWVARSIARFTPNLLKDGPPPGTWRSKLAQMTVLENIFNDIIVAVDDSSIAWYALEMAITLAKYEDSRVHGIHIHPAGSEQHNHHLLEERFNSLCRDSQLNEYDFHSTKGEIGAVLCESAKFADLVLLPLNHPPDDRPISRLSSGLTAIIRGCPAPVLTVPGPIDGIKSILLAFDGSLKAVEALYIAAYFGTQLSSEVYVLTSEVGLISAEQIQDQAKTYLEQFPLKAKYTLSTSGIAEAIKDFPGIDLILMGGYGGSTIRDLVVGTVVDQVLRDIKLPVLICR